ncbi:two component transcriptional regulator, winged helix family [[Leptolyngbya] sp. PCC 7376]|uniref:response regulator transcription factor RpaB n=1 Tax=[Leptolyngbya] sp. PCC 7376 TaxID=111781 RepID=UPI00029F485D|nr:response regulator [[Leptolyngbya] sp. PCC 7376]AFY40467.1 two component transcriptional regulator, winged helix family [[Leptolyngbya] sp. PCC 7376]
MVESKATILVVDDEIAVRRILNTRLSMIGYDIITAADGDEALEVFWRERPDLVILDVMMPKRDGYYVCQEIRRESDTPIIMLTALGDVADRITGLRFGADDYLVKPFSPKELEARIHCILRRTKKQQNEVEEAGVLRIANLVIDTNRRKVLQNGNVLRLTHIEFDLLHLLVNQAGNPLSRTDILTAIWGYVPRRHSDLRVVDVHVSRLRSKIEEDPRQPEFIITERGTGYLFRKAPSSAASIAV